MRKEIGRNPLEMTAKRNIVVGIDLGRETEQVVSYAAFFAAALRTGVRLLYVIDYLLTPPSYLSGYVEEEKTREEAGMTSWKFLLEREGIDAECSVLLGRLQESFVRVLEETSPPLLVIGFRSHLVRPSSSERLIRSLKSPVLVVRGKKASGVSVGSVEIKKILCPVDFSEGSRRAITAAKEYAAFFSAELDLVHVIPSHVIEEKWVAWKKLSAREKKKFKDFVLSEAGLNLDAFCREMQIGAKGRVLQGRPSEVIAAVAEEEGHDLIVIGARGLSYTESVLLGGTTEAVLKSSPCPLLIVH
jgi:nucleotide-binding universal stress UspA family protein